MVEQDRQTPDKFNTHWLLLALLLLFAALALYYSLRLPLGEASDETHHFALVRFIAAEGRPPLTVVERQAIGPKGDASPVYHALVALLIQPVDMSSLPELLDGQARPERFIPFDQRLPTQFLHTEDELAPFRGVVLAWHLARLPSILMGIAALAGVYLTTLTIYPRRPYFALTATALAAFIPRFVISSAVVNDDNPVLPLIFFTIYCLIRIARGDQRRGLFIILGILAGLAAIVKYHSLVLLPEIALALFLVAWRDRWGWPTLLRRWGWSLLAFSLTSGWWFSYLFYQFNELAGRGWLGGLLAPLGDPITTGGLDNLAGSSSPAAFGWLDWAGLLFQTFWVEYAGLRIVASPPVYAALGLLSLFAALGLTRLSWLKIRQRNQSLTSFILGRLAPTLLALHFLVYFSLVMMRYLASPSPETAQGRHLYPALSSIAFFLVLGWSQVWSRQGPRLDKTLFLGVSGAFISLSLLTLAVFILPRIPYLPIARFDPASIPISTRLDAPMAEGIRLAGFDLGSSAPAAGQSLPVTLYWQAEAKQEQDYLIQLCLRDSASRPITCRYSHPVDGRYPVRAWEPGFLVRDESYLPVPGCLSPGDYELTLSILPLRRDRAVTTVDDSQPASPLLSLSRVTLLPGPSAPARDIELWAGGAYASQEIELAQLRQSLTVLAAVPAGMAGDDGDSLKFTAAVGADPAVKMEWLPVAPGLAYECSGDSIVTTYNFIIDPTVTPGRYHLSQSARQHITPVVAVLTRKREFSSPANIPVEANADFSGELELLGYEADLSPRWPGDAIELTAYWRAQRMMARNYVAILKLLDKDFTMWGQAEPVIGGRQPTVLWAPGELIVESYRLPVAPGTPPGLYTIEFSVLYDHLAGQFYFVPVSIPAGSEPAEHLYLGPVRVMDPARLEEPARPLTAILGDQIELLGYDLNGDLTETQQLDLTLHWRAVNPPETDYTVFVQLIGPDGQVQAQQDNQPQAGRYPTTAWILQDRVVDRYNLSVNSDLPAGRYRLLAGMYNLETGQRLPAIAAGGQRLPDDAILITTFDVD